MNLEDKENIEATEGNAGGPFRGQGLDKDKLSGTEKRGGGEDRGGVRVAEGDGPQSKERI